MCGETKVFAVKYIGKQLFLSLRKKKMKDVRFYQVQTQNEGHYEFKTLAEVSRHMREQRIELCEFGEQDAIGDIEIIVPQYAEAREKYCQAKKRYFGIN